MIFSDDWVDQIPKPKDQTEGCHLQEQNDVDPAVCGYRWLIVVGAIAVEIAILAVSYYGFSQGGYFRP